MFVAFEGNQTRGLAFRVPRPEFGRQMKPMEGVEEKQRPDPFIKIFAAAAKGVELGAFFHQRLQGKPRAEGIERLIADGRIGGSDDTN